MNEEYIRAFYRDIARSPSFPSTLLATCFLWLHLRVIKVMTSYLALFNH